jgi:hypothetical protein
VKERLTAKELADEERQTRARVRHECAEEHNAHVEHGATVHLVQSEPTVIVMSSCPCGLSYTMTDGRFSSGNRRFYETMEARGDSFYEWLMADPEQ